MADKTQVFYDSQCEICQAGVSWLRLLDGHLRRTDCVPMEREAIARAGLDPEACNRELHIVTPGGGVRRGWSAVAWLARRFPSTWVIGALGAIPPFNWIGHAIYGWVARNRYGLSKCRGGACQSWKPGAERAAQVGALRSCHRVGMLMRMPLSVAAIVRQVARNCLRFARTYRRRIVLLDGRLELLVLNGLPCDLVSLLFGEHFVAIVYDGVMMDPGPTRLRGALGRQLKKCGAIHTVAATHHHEEHAANLNWVAERTGAAIYVGAATAQCLAHFERLPWIREFMIGQRPELQQPYHVLGERLGDLEVFASPGHCDDHVVLYDRREKILFAGDSFMGAYFSAPNPDVDSRSWIDTLQRLLALDIEILVEGHGHIHTLRTDIPDSCPLVVRHDPRQGLLDKLRFCEWLRDQVGAGIGEGLPAAAIEVTCFPWGRRFSWESFFNDELTRWLSRGHWSRAELVRSFVRPADSNAVLPVVYEARIHTVEAVAEDAAHSPESAPRAN